MKERERERERERECVCVCVRERESVCVCEGEGEIESVSEVERNDASVLSESFPGYPESRLWYGIDGLAESMCMCSSAKALSVCVCLWFLCLPMVVHVVSFSSHVRSCGGLMVHLVHRGCAALVLSAQAEYLS